MCVHAVLSDERPKEMEQDGLYSNEECVMGAPHLCCPKDINREREREKEPMPPLLADKSAVKTKGCKNAMAKS